MWWLKPVISGAIGMIGASQQKAPPKYKRTEDEEKMVTSLENKARDGFNVDERLRQRSRPVLDIASSQKGGALGRAIGRGMQNSIITEQLLSKVDRETQDKISSMSNEIAIQNQQYKDQAEGQLHSFYQQEGGAIRQNDADRVAHGNQKRATQMSALSGMASGLLSGTWDKEGDGFEYSPPNMTPDSNTQYDKSWLIQSMNQASLDGDTTEFNRLNELFRQLFPNSQ